MYITPFLFKGDDKVIQKLFVTTKTILEHLWMDIIHEAQDEYNKPIRLNPNDGSDWRRELL